MQDSETRHKLVKANKERTSIECGGESKRSLEEVKAEIERLRVQLEFEEYVTLVNRKADLRGELVGADVAREAARLQLRAAEKKYNDLRTEASNVEFRLSMLESDRERAVAVA